MAGFGDVVKKAFYLGVGVASYAGEKAGHTLKDLQEQTQVVVNELVARGEITAEEAQRLVNDMVSKAQATMPDSASSPEPRRIEILDDEPSPPAPPTDQAEILRQQVSALRQELESLKRKASHP
jgi:polyhydroxyalkanoate synthesis regulator phasin